MTAPGDPYDEARRRPLGVGLIVPQWEGHLDGQTPGWPDARAVAQAAEAVVPPGVRDLGQLRHRNGRARLAFAEPP